ncbi:unnamed protein product [Adineta ricciae]|uniref:Uncharacterized protein n=1 Tax=Adineta ricciae TaxID=249248 RepID=A0A813MT70_ADIRI|nr:unnamed protein product [Adineta ricciae]CAF1438498.1 unnamed protein product [Adineta ricciae]
MFINELSHLFPRTTSLTGNKPKSSIKITLSFHNFLQLQFEDYSFYELFGDKSDLKTTFTLELTSNGRITFSPMAFHHIKVDQMFLHSSSVEPYSFEEIFNNTNINDLTIEGCTPRSNETAKMNFNGKIRLAKFTKMVETVSSEEFPDYPVRSMIIEAHEARKLNASSFTNYRNLYGLHLVRPKFFFDNRSFDGFQYLTGLETIELDAETLKDHTFQHASRIQSFTLGPNTRHLTEHSLDELNYLTRFDASKVILDQLYPSSRCVLARYIAKQQKANPTMTILPPQAEYCDCIHDFILTILDKKPDQTYTDLCSDNQQERCQLSECNIVKNFRIPPREKTTDDDNDGLFSTHPMPSYVHRHPSQTNDKHDQSELPHSHIRDSQTSALKANKPIDPNAIPTDDYDDNGNPSTVGGKTYEERRLILRNETLKWIALSLICITILVLLIVGIIIWFFHFRPSQRYNKAGFQVVQPNNSNV